MRAEDHFHVGVVVDDLDAALARLSDLFGYRWSGAFEGRIPVWLPGGDREVDLRFVYSRTTPRIEVIQSVEGTVWVPSAGSGVHHLGYWSDDVEGDAARLAHAGAVMEAAGRTPGGAAQWSYHRAPDGPRIELVDRALQPFLEKFWSE
ncbi:MAG TPA: VOC family protein [Acidimicrobiales bacterium]|nr:VOC family protein [Acidimicrobiales bacterium]